MCLLLIAIDAVPGFPLLLLGNRDEFHARASAPAQPWDGDTHVVGGRDLVACGSWLALRPEGRFAAVTNLRPGVTRTAPRSRGALVRDFVVGDTAPAAFLDALRGEAGEHGPFNLVVGDCSGVCATGSTVTETLRLHTGVHVISNGDIGVRWPKTERLRQQFVDAVEDGLDQGSERLLLNLLRDETQPHDSGLPDTGVGLDLERRLAPIFIRGKNYGTRAATLVARHVDGTVIVHERRFGPDASMSGEVRWHAQSGTDFREQRI